MQQREKVLAAIFGGAIALWLGLPWFESTFLAPLKELAGQEEQLDKEIEKNTASRLELAKASRDLKGWRKQSLPPDPLIAQRLYEEWVSSLATMSGLEVSQVKLEQRVPEKDIYHRIPVTLQANGTLQELAMFIDRFESVDLIHRLSKCEVGSPANEGNPELKLLITAEGLSMNDAAKRSRLFPESAIEEELSRETREVTVADGTGFPETVPFLARINDELVNVTEINGTQWTLQRGVQQTFASNHGADQSIELFPLLVGSDLESEDSKALWETSLFTKPAPKIDYDPKLASVVPPPVIQGKPWTWTMEVTSWDPANGAPLFSLLDGPDGIDVNERTGNLSWTAGPDVPVGEYIVEAVVWGQANRNSGFTSIFELKVREPNLPPTLAPIEQAHFYLGRESVVRVEASDPDSDVNRLKYELSDAPEGMAINSRGEIRWTPAMESEPQELKVTVTVTDNDEFAESATLSIPVSVEEDSARFAYLVACLDLKPKGREAWIFDRATNKKTILHEGDSIQIADFDLSVDTIGDDHVLMHDEDEDFRLGFDQSVSEMTRIPKPMPEEEPMDGEEKNESSRPPAPTLPEESDSSEIKETSEEAKADPVEAQKTEAVEASESDAVPLEEDFIPAGENAPQNDGDS